MESKNSGDKFSAKKLSSRRWCCVKGCKSKAIDKATHTDVGFHYFPKLNEGLVKIQNFSGEYEKVNRRELWKQILNIERPVTKYMQVCSLHFKKSDYILPDFSKTKRYLKKNAIPSCNLPNSTTSIKTSTGSETNQIKNDGQFFKVELIEVKDECVPNEVDYSINSTNEDDQGCANHAVDIDDDNIIHEQIKQELDSSISSDCPPPEKVLIDFGVQVTSGISSDCPPPEKKLTDFGVQVTSGDLINDFFDTINTEKELSNLTGIANFNILNTLMKIVTRDNPRYVYPHMKLRSKLILTFMKLKHNISYAVLKVLYKCPSISQCRKIILGMLNKLSECLKNAITFPTREEIAKNIPLCFKDFGDVRIVLNCMEIHLQKPQDLCCQKTTYSRRKNDFTIKFINGFTPGGLISFVSEAYGGKIPDDDMFEHSKILDQLEKGDAVMVDKGCKIEHLCIKKDIKLIHSSLINHKKKYTEEEAQMNSKIARARAYIDRTNQKLKAFKVLSTKMPSGLVIHADKIMIIIATIVNMSSPILSNETFKP